MFADNTNFPLAGTRDNLQRAHAMIKFYNEGLGAKLINLNSIAIWASEKERGWTWGEEGLKWLALGQLARYLGYPLGYKMAQE